MRPPLALLCSTIVLALVSGCGLTHSRQLVYPNQISEQSNAPPRRAAARSAPVLNLRVDDRTEDFGSTLDD